MARLTKVRTVAGSEWALDAHYDATRNRISSRPERSEIPFELPELTGQRLTKKQAMASLGSVVYAVRTADGLIKIGFTTNLYDRVRFYRMKAELLAFMSGGWELEQSLHERFRGSRAHGREWYHPTLEVMQWVNDVRQSLRLPRVLEVSPERAAEIIEQDRARG